MIALLSCMALAASLHADPDSLEGRFTLHQAGSDDPAVVAEEATQGLRRMMRNRMRSALEEALAPSPTVEIRLDGDAYLIIGDDDQTLRVVPGGPEVQQETPQGETAAILASLQEGSLEIRIRTSRAERVQTLTPTEAGLRVVNTFIVAQLSQPVRAEFNYLREGAPHPAFEGRPLTLGARLLDAEVDR
jgi:hypothetical protein